MPQLCIRYCLQLGTLPLPRTATPTHMRGKVGVDFTISDADIATLRGVEPIKDYGDAPQFPVFGMKADGSARGVDEVRSHREPAARIRQEV